MKTIIISANISLKTLTNLDLIVQDKKNIGLRVSRSELIEKSIKSLIKKEENKKNKVSK